MYLNWCGLKSPLSYGLVGIEVRSKEPGYRLDIYQFDCKQKSMYISIKNILIVMKHIFYHLAAVIVVVVWGMTFISTKVLIVHDLSAQEIFLFRFLLAYAAVCPISFHRFFARNLKDELYLVGGGVLGGSLFFFLQNIALGLTQASNVSFIICTAPLLTAVLTVLSVRTEKVSRGFIYGSIVALLGVGLLIFNGSFILRISPLGDLLTLLASLSWAFYSLVIRSLTRKYSPAFITRKIFFYGIITILPTFLFLPSLTKPAVLLDSEVWSNLLFLGVIASSACYLLWNIVVKQLGTIQASNYLYLNPLATTVGATIFLHEEVTPVAVVGIVLVLSGVYLATRNSRPQNCTAIKSKRTKFCLFYYYYNHMQTTFGDKFEIQTMYYLCCN